MNNRSATNDEPKMNSAKRRKVVRTIHANWTKLRFYDNFDAHSIKRTLLLKHPLLLKEFLKETYNIVYTNVIFVLNLLKFYLKKKINTIINVGVRNKALVLLRPIFPNIVFGHSMFIRVVY